MTLNPYEHTSQEDTTSCRDSRPQDSTSHYDFYLFTDGSGFTDHFGGFGAVVLSTRHVNATYVPSCGCSTHMETGRAEFTAVLTALHSIVEVMGWDNPGTICKLEANKPAILITSDREDLVGSINRVFARKKNGDLWAQFEWYERFMDIEARHIKRATNPTHDIADALASEMRLVIIDFFTTQQSCKNI